MMSNSENKLIHSVVLKLIVISGILSALIVAGMIIYNSWEAELCKPIFSGKCLTNFSYNMQLPTKLITATFALSGFWILIFRSHQTSEQIKTSQKQIQLTIENNTFNNYISHKKSFNEMLEYFEYEHECRVINKPGLYKSIFPQNSPIYMSFKGDLRTLNECYDYYEKDRINLLKKLDSYSNEYVFMSHKELNEIINYWDEFIESLFLQNLRFSNLKITQYQTNDKKPAKLPKYPLQTLNLPYYLHEQIHHFSSSQKFTREEPNLIDQVMPNKLQEHYEHITFTNEDEL